MRLTNVLPGGCPAASESTHVRALFVRSLHVWRWGRVTLMRGKLRVLLIRAVPSEGAVPSREVALAFDVLVENLFGVAVGVEALFATIRADKLTLALLPAFALLSATCEVRVVSFRFGLTCILPFAFLSHIVWFRHVGSHGA